MKNLTKYAVKIPDILLPKDIDLSTWAVIACDQYTHDEKYWKNVSKITEGKPSSLNLILPEVYLNREDNDEAVSAIQTQMRAYLDEGIFADEERECVYVERETSYGRTRKGLVAAIDLDAYDWKAGSSSLIRATEATVPERLPPRMKIRQGAPLELPHIMLLVDDKENSLIGACEKLRAGSSPVYSGKLMLNGGRVSGWAIKGEQAENLLESALSSLYEKAARSENGSVFLFAVGDGNHSLASAKAVWEEYKQRLIEKGASEQELFDCRARYALVEIVNIYDEALTFEPIHRAMFDFDSEELLNYVRAALEGTIEDAADENALLAFQSSSSSDESAGSVFKFAYTKGGRFICKVLKTKIKELAISRLQPVLDNFMTEKRAPKDKIDYIHGSQDALNLAKKENVTAILLPPIAKESFFDTINTLGSLPRKSFSMGEANEKRFYVEARRLFS